MMERLALRLATVAALTNGGNEPSPTLAGSNVFDSQDAAASDLKTEERAPIIVVRTEDDTSSFAKQSGVQLDERLVEVVMHLAICHGGTGSIIDNIADTDARAEALLDLMEYQVANALRGRGVWAEWWRNRRGGPTIYRWQSLPLWPEPRRSAVRLAARQINMQCRLPDECFPTIYRHGALAVNSLGVAIMPAGALPYHLLQVFEYIDAHGAGDLKAYAAEIRAALESEELPAARVVPDLLSIVTKWPNAPGKNDAYPFFEGNLLDPGSGS